MFGMRLQMINSDFESKTDTLHHQQLNRWKPPLLLFATVVVTIGMLWLAWQWLPPQFIRRQMGFAPVQIDYTSPGGSRDVRIIISDGGATGWGVLTVYERQRFLGYKKVWTSEQTEANAAALTVIWLTEDTIQIAYPSVETDGAIKVLDLRNN